VKWSLDHLVVGARTLAEGVAWCEATFGIVPGAGGEHPSMSTHNRLFTIGSERFPKAYFEIIAINPAAPPPGRVRWYDLDQPALQAMLADGPALIHWVAGCDDIRADCASLSTSGIDRGEVLAVERATPRGPLRWQISVRADGHRLANGALPTLIQWGAVHPADAMPASGVTIERLVLGGALPAGVAAALPEGIVASQDSNAASLAATFSTPRGPVALTSKR
jgi:hypothetical protein